MDQATDPDTEEALARLREFLTTFGGVPRREIPNAGTAGEDGSSDSPDEPFSSDSSDGPSRPESPDGSDSPRASGEPHDPGSPNGSGSSHEPHTLGSPNGPRDPGSSDEPFDSVHDLQAELAAVVDGYEDALRRKAQIEAEMLTWLAHGEDIVYRMTRLHGSDESSEVTHRTVVAEFAAVARVTPRTMESRIGHAGKVVNEYPKLQETLANGDTTYAHTQVVVDEGLHIRCPEKRSAYEKAVLPAARKESVSRFRAIAKKLAQAAHEESLDARHQAVRKERRVRVTSAEDGMVNLFAFLPAVEGHAIWDKLSQEALELRNLEKQEGDESGSSLDARSMDELRADALIDSILNHEAWLVPDSTSAPNPDSSSASTFAARSTFPAGSTSASGPNRGHESVSPLAPGAEALSARYASSKVQILIPAGLMLAVQDMPDETRALIAEALGSFDDAQLAGYGPVHAAAAREVAGDSTAWDRLFVDSDGGLMSVDRYRPSEQMRRFLSARDQHCRFPGCRMPVIRCDLDHTDDYATGGRTEIGNLAYLCRGHHTLKHHGGWKVKQSDGGTMNWTSPAGRRYRDKPSSRVFFKPSRSSGPPGPPDPPDPADPPDPSDPSDPAAPGSPPQAAGNDPEGATTEGEEGGASKTNFLDEEPPF